MNMNSENASNHSDTTTSDRDGSANHPHAVEAGKGHHIDDRDAFQPERI